MEPRFQSLFAYWQSIAPADGLPGRQHVDPIAMPRSLLPHVALYDIVPAGDDFRIRCRLSGTGVVELLGADNTGRFIDETMPADGYRPLHDSFRTLMQTRTPQYWQRTLPYPDRSFIGIRRLALPLAADGVTVDMAMSCYMPMLRIVRDDGEAGG